MRSLTQGDIKIKYQAYTMQATDNKRSFTFNSKGRIIKSIPFIINKLKEIIN